MTKNEAPRGKPRGILSGILPKPNTLLRSAKSRASEGLFSLAPSSPQQVAGYLAKENKKDLHQKAGDPKGERTVVLIKPDGVKRGLVGEIISRIEKRGLKVIAASMIWPTDAQIDAHYPKDPVWVKRLGEKSLETYAKYGWDPIKEMGTRDPAKIGKSVRAWIVDFMVSGPVFKMIVEGIHSIDMVRKLVGKSIPALAEMGTIRGDFSVDSAALANKNKRAVHNLVHASETAEESAHEISFWFKPEEIHDYKRAEEDVMF